MNQLLFSQASWALILCLSWRENLPGFSCCLVLFIHVSTKGQKKNAQKGELSEAWEGPGLLEMRAFVLQGSQGLSGVSFGCHG